MQSVIEECGGENGRLWLKEFNISVIVHAGVSKGVFDTYDLAPNLFPLSSKQGASG